MNEQIEAYDGTNNFYSNDTEFKFNKNKMNKEIEDILAEYGYVNMDYDTRRALILIILEYSSRQLKKKDEEIAELKRSVFNAESRVELLQEENASLQKEIAEWREECERLAGISKFWQEKYYELNPPIKNPKIDNL